MNVADLDEAAERLAALIREEDAHLLLSYDPHGGYGHPDHVQVHRVGARAAELTGIRVLEATVPRELVRLAFGPARLLRLVVRYDPRVIHASFTPRAAITHRVNVRECARQKRAALAEHRSFIAGTGRSARLARVLLGLPAPVCGLAFGLEWFAEPGAAAAAPIRDVLQAAGARTAPPGTGQNASSGSSIASSEVASAISRSAASRGSTVAAKNPAAATLPW